MLSETPFVIVFCTLLHSVIVSMCLQKTTFLSVRCEAERRWPKIDLNRWSMFWQILYSICFSRMRYALTPKPYVAILIQPSGVTSWVRHKVEKLRHRCAIHFCCHSCFISFIFFRSLKSFLPPGLVFIMIFIVIVMISTTVRCQVLLCWLSCACSYFVSREFLMRTNTTLSLPIICNSPLSMTCLSCLSVSMFHSFYLFFELFFFLCHFFRCQCPMISTLHTATSITSALSKANHTVVGFARSDYCRVLLTFRTWMAREAE